jgi:hypothetical protein
VSFFSFFAARFCARARREPPFFESRRALLPLFLPTPAPPFLDLPRALAHTTPPRLPCPRLVARLVAAPPTPQKKNPATTIPPTVYGNDGLSTIFQGSCMLPIQQDKGTGFDIAALSDAMPEFQGSCGSCYEVACRNAQVKDGYGETLDRTSSCTDESRVVVVTITDSCPCVHANYYSNKRWCCGDNGGTPHLDLSTEAFRKIARTSDGVAAIRYRRVACPQAPTYLDWDGDTPKQKQEQQQQQGGGGGGGGGRRMLCGAGPSA